MTRPRGARAPARAAKCSASCPDRPDRTHVESRKMPVKLPQGVTRPSPTGDGDREGRQGRARRCRSPTASAWSQEGQTLSSSRPRARPTHDARRRPRAPRARTSRTWCTGVTKGFERKLELVGVGYRAAVQGKNLNLTLGFSHPVSLRGARKASRSRRRARPKSSSRAWTGRRSARSPPRSARYRPPEPYKGKGVRYAGEKIVMKEAQEEVRAWRMRRKKTRRLRRATPRPRQDPGARNVRA